jgi:hypothetical protein
MRRLRFERKIFFQSFFMLTTIQPSFVASSYSAWGRRSAPVRAVVP